MKIINHNVIDFKNNFWALLCVFFILTMFSFLAIGEENIQQKSGKTDSEILSSLDAQKNQINNDIFLVEEKNDMKESDHFDNINIESMFSDPKLKNNSGEEKTINRLDKSNLIDFEDSEDGWWSDVIEDVEIEDID